MLSSASHIFRRSSASPFTLFFNSSLLKSAFPGSPDFKSVFFIPVFFISRFFHLSSEFSSAAEFSCCESSCIQKFLFIVKDSCMRGFLRRISFPICGISPALPLSFLLTCGISQALLLSFLPSCGISSPFSRPAGFSAASVAILSASYKY